LQFGRGRKNIAQRCRRRSGKTTNTEFTEIGTQRAQRDEKKWRVKEFKSLKV
jgi:hypothetical protein